MKYKSSFKSVVLLSVVSAIVSSQLQADDDIYTTFMENEEMALLSSDYSDATAPSQVTVDAAGRLLIFSASNLNTPIIILDPNDNEPSITVGGRRVLLDMDGAVTPTMAPITSRATHGDNSMANGSSLMEPMSLLGAEALTGITIYGDNAIVAGVYASAYGFASQAVENASAFGWNSNALGYASSAYGQLSKATKIAANAYGRSSEATGDYSSVYGSFAKASGGHSSAFGAYSSASGTYASAYGYASSALGNYSFAGGVSSKALNHHDVALGNNAKAEGSSSVALGVGSIASGGGSLALGGSAQASGYASIAHGYGSQANPHSIAIGESALAANDYQIAIGAFNYADPDALFMLGSGTSSALRSNALTVMKTGELRLKHKNYVAPTEETPNPEQPNALFVEGSATIKGVLRVSPAGDIPMGEFTAQ